MKNNFNKKSEELLNLFEANKVLTSVSRLNLFFDEPKIFQFNAILKSSIKTINSNKYQLQINATGLSFFSKEQALFKCLCESAERLSLYSYEKKPSTADLMDDIERNKLNIIYQKKSR